MDHNQLDTAGRWGRREPSACFASFAFREQEIDFQEGPEALLDIEHRRPLRMDARALPPDSAALAAGQRAGPAARINATSRLGQGARCRWGAEQSWVHRAFIRTPTPCSAGGTGAGRGGSVGMKKGKMISRSTGRSPAGARVSQTERIATGRRGSGCEFLTMPPAALPGKVKLCRDKRIRKVKNRKHSGNYLKRKEFYFERKLLNYSSVFTFPLPPLTPASLSAVKFIENFVVTCKSHPHMRSNRAVPFKTD